MTRVVIIAYGSRGDVAPFTGLGIRLREAGHDVAIAATAGHADLVRNAGLEYRFLATEPEKGARGEAASRYLADSSWRNTRKLVPDMVTDMRQVAPSMIEAASADVLLLSAVATVLG